MKSKRSLQVIEPPTEPTQPTPVEAENGNCKWPTWEERIRRGQEMVKRLEAGNPIYTRAPY